MLPARHAEDDPAPPEIRIAAAAGPASDDRLAVPLMLLRVMRATVEGEAGRTAIPTALPVMVLPSMTLPTPERLSPSVLPVNTLLAMVLRWPPLIWTPSE